MLLSGLADFTGEAEEGGVEDTVSDTATLRKRTVSSCGEKSKETQTVNKKVP